MPRRALISLILRVTGNVNADMSVGTRIPLKKIITWNHEVRPYISARCIKRCIRERLYEKNFSIDPLTLIEYTKSTKQLVDFGNPVDYVDDDLFGFLYPQIQQPRIRVGPVKVSHLISLRHAEVKVEFAARFPRQFIPRDQKDQRENPVPFEVELADWLGKLNVIVSDRVGRFTKDELDDEAKKKLGGKLELKSEEREKRLRGLLEILLWEGWIFPRGSQSPSVPDFNYAVIALTDRFIPIFGFIDVDDEGKLNEELLEKMRKLYDGLLGQLWVIRYKDGKYTHYYRKDKESELNSEEKVLDSSTIDGIIKEICEYMVKDSR
ncbi:MAG: type I-B CRISPR-associated protein Cas7/Cst2/DevR [Thermofilaceae archaeon]|nr:type I-B CRISPR-associated protein Cas7/Cst2/DevR [Thermofilaceae archaeon]MCX8179957.1 type I-B CRISPR-associated protein Cas7/Cst2/DevR [Thermofilaceae archaeon]MDW8004737.1 type I-B CRISPR-associated protein Cas7/Cst2/DevR [Thermofilaceae archaeon]